jgi:hypothetical protein
MKKVRKKWELLVDGFLEKEQPIKRLREMIMKRSPLTPIDGVLVMKLDDPLQVLAFFSVFSNNNSQFDFSILRKQLMIFHSMNIP